MAHTNGNFTGVRGHDFRGRSSAGALLCRTPAVVRGITDRSCIDEAVLAHGGRGYGGTAQQSRGPAQNSSYKPHSVRRLLVPPLLGPLSCPSSVCRSKATCCAWATRCGSCPWRRTMCHLRGTATRRSTGGAPKPRATCCGRFILGSGRRCTSTGRCVICKVLLCLQTLTLSLSLSLFLFLSLSRSLARSFSLSLSLPPSLSLSLPLSLPLSLCLSLSLARSLACSPPAPQPLTEQSTVKFNVGGHFQYAGYAK